jgi:hypothetical protein
MTADLFEDNLIDWLNNAGPLLTDHLPGQFVARDQQTTPTDGRAEAGETPRSRRIPR